MTLNRPERHPHDFYVYEHLKADTGEVFYVGKGKGFRAWSNQRNQYWKNVAAKHGVTVRVVRSGLQEWYALEMEIDLINKYGRDGLANLTDGGEGSAGHLRSDETKALMSRNIRASLQSPEIKKKHSDALKVAMNKPATKRVRAAIMQSDSYRQKQRAGTSARFASESARSAHRALLNSPEVRAIHRASKGCLPILCVETGDVFQTTTEAQEWLSANGLEKARGHAVWAVCNGARKSAYGYTWRYDAPQNITHKDGKQ